MNEHETKPDAAEDETPPLPGIPAAEMVETEIDTNGNRGEPSAPNAAFQPDTQPEAAEPETETTE